MNETKIFNFMESIGKIDAKIVEESDRAFALARVRRMRKMKAVIISAACIALAASMAVASFFWLNKPDGDMTGLTPPNNVNGVTPNVTPVLPPDDTDNSLSDRVEAGYAINSGFSAPINVALSTEKEFLTTQEKIPFMISVGIHENNDTFFEDCEVVALKIKMNVSSYGHEGIEYNSRLTLNDVVLREMTTEQFIEDNNFYSYVDVPDDNGNVVSKRAFKNVYEIFIDMSDIRSAYEIPYRTTSYGVLHIGVDVVSESEWFQSGNDMGTVSLKFKIEDGKLIFFK